MTAPFLQTPQDITVYYQLVGEQSGPCALSKSLSSIPATPLTVSLQAGSSALNLMERATDLDSTLSFTVSNVFGIFYSPVTIADITIIPQCLWCLTYIPFDSQDVVIPEVGVQNFVIPGPGTTLRMAYTSTCQSSFQVALARHDMTYFKEKGIFNSKTCKTCCSKQKECCCDQEKSFYTPLILAVVVAVSILFLCTRYFR